MKSKIKEIMTSDVHVILPECSIQEAAQKMRAGDFGILPIGEYDRLVGMITDRDITIRGTADGKDALKVQVREIMSKDVLYCFEDQTLDEVTKNFGDNQVRRLAVLNRQKRLVGILSLGDLAQSSANPEKVEEALSRISKNTNIQSDART